MTLDDTDDMHVKLTVDLTGTRLACGCIRISMSRSEDMVSWMLRYLLPKTVMIAGCDFVLPASLEITHLNRMGF